MEKIQLVDNQHTRSLEAYRPPLSVYAGWNEAITRKLGNITRYYETPPIGEDQAANEWSEWYNETPRATYLLGRRTSILALATFEEALLATNEIAASHMFNLQVFADVDRDILKYFCYAVHDDYDTWSGATWLELDPDGNTDTTLFATINYWRVPVDDRIIMARYSWG